MEFGEGEIGEGELLWRKVKKKVKKKKKIREKEVIEVMIGEIECMKNKKILIYSLYLILLRFNDLF